MKEMLIVINNYIKKWKKDNEAKIKNYNKNYNSQKIKCPNCNKEINITSLKKHKQRKH